MTACPGVDGKLVETDAGVLELQRRVSVFIVPGMEVGHSSQVFFCIVHIYQLSALCN